MSERQKSDGIEEANEMLLDQGFVAVVLTTFSTVFLAELGDKTQIATLLLSAQSGKPLIIFLGSSSALICSSLVAVLLGRWLSRTMPPDMFKYMAGFLLVALGIWLATQAAIPLFSAMEPVV